MPRGDWEINVLTSSASIWTLGVHVMVAAKNTVGTGPKSAASPAIKIGTPAPPTGVRATKVAPHNLKVAFVPGSNNGAKITGYTATCTSSNHGVSKSKTGSASPITVSGTSADKRYTCVVAAKNARGIGPASGPSKAVIA